MSQTLQQKVLYSLIVQCTLLFEARLWLPQESGERAALLEIHLPRSVVMKGQAQFGDEATPLEVLTSSSLCLTSISSVSLAVSLFSSLARACSRTRAVWECVCVHVCMYVGFAILHSCTAVNGCLYPPGQRRLDKHSSTGVVTCHLLPLITFRISAICSLRSSKSESSRTSHIKELGGGGLPRTFPFLS